MHDDSPFLHAIREAPFDDGPRLVWADWLDEWGECARAEFIRLQCELAALDAEPPSGRGESGVKFCRRVELRRRERELIPRAWWAWCCPDFLKGRQWSVCRDQSEIAVYAAAGPPEVELTFLIRRGLVEAVTLTCRQFLDVAAALFRAAPVTEVRLSDREPYHAFGRFNWYDSGRPPTARSVYPASDLPSQLFDRLPGGKSEAHRRHYDAAADALSALSAACVALGRARADLPALAPVDAPGAGA
jgi:uncharacterized protein (TIGR02996 family)